jgi:EAL domain-containing protein (putative c-di-GMP-specific phosphodiesterase class I)
MASKKPTGMTGIRRAGVANLTVLVMPILEITPAGARLHALECLIRGPKGSKLESPADLFEFVRSQNTQVRFDSTCLELQLQHMGQLPGDPRISLNVHAATLCEDAAFAGALETVAWGNAIAPSRLTIEISDYGPHAENPALATAVKALRALGVRIALDDSGLGDPDFRLFLDLKPDYLKIDRYLVRGLASEESSRGILEGLISLSKSLGFRIVAEGVENAEDLRTVSAMGIDLVQGFHFGEPVSPDTLRTGVLVARNTIWGPKV